MKKLKDNVDLREATWRTPREDTLLKASNNSGAQPLKGLVAMTSLQAHPGGETLAAVAGHLQPQLRTVMRVVQLKGGIPILSAQLKTTGH